MARPAGNGSSLGTARSLGLLVIICLLAAHAVQAFRCQHTPYGPQKEDISMQGMSKTHQQPHTQATCYKPDPVDSSAVDVDDLEWVLTNRIENVSQANVFNFKNIIFDQIYAGKGELHWCVRWESSQKVSTTQRDNIHKLIETNINAWNDKLKGFDCWPYDRITVKVVGWAVKDASLLAWGNETGIPVYVNYIESDAVSCPSPCGRFFAYWGEKDYTYSKCDGGWAKHFDMTLWATTGFNGGAGGDWGQRMSDDYVLSAANTPSSQAVILAHEMGHGFGLPDFYTTADQPPDGQIPPAIMEAGASATITEFDTWMIRRTWSDLKAKDSARFPLINTTTVSSTAAPVKRSSSSSTAPVRRVSSTATKTAGPRPVASSTAVANPCATVNCGSHGQCVSGKCVCTDGYSGSRCEAAPYTGYVWVSEMGACSKPCGTGTRTTTVYCALAATGAKALDSRCDPLTKPASDSEECNTQACDSSCVVSLACSNKWSGGWPVVIDYYHFTFTVAGQASSGWTLSFKLNGGKLQGLWGGARVLDDGSKSGTVQLVNQDWWKSLPVTVGGIVSQSMAFSDFTLNGNTVCVATTSEEGSVSARSCTRLGVTTGSTNSDTACADLSALECDASDTDCQEFKNSQSLCASANSQSDDSTNKKTVLFVSAGVAVLVAVCAVVALLIVRRKKKAHTTMQSTTSNMSAALNEGQPSVAI